MQDERKTKINQEAKKIHDVLFEPEVAELTKSIELPVAGQPYSPDSLRMALEVVSFANEIPVGIKPEDIEDDIDGQRTIRYLGNPPKIKRGLS